MSQHRPLKTMMKGAVLLSIAAFIAKVLSAVYRVPFQNMVGNTGFYVYQQVYPLYGIGMTFALSGFPVFLSNIIAEHHRQQNLRKILIQSFVIMTILGITCFSFIFGFAESIAQYMGDVQLHVVVRSVSWMFLLMPFLVVMRGYFQGTFRMLPTAISQVIEQLIRIIVILIVANLYATNQLSLYQMGQWAMSSATVAAIAAIGVLVIAYLKERKESKRAKDIDDVRQTRRTIDTIPHSHDVQSSNRQTLTWSILTKRFIIEGGTICLLTSMLVFYQLIDSFTIFNGLTANGILEELAKDLKGIYDRGQPLVQLGMVVGIGFSTSYMPMMTKAYLENKYLDVQKSASSLLRMTMAFAASATVGMLAILPRLNHMLFGDIEGTSVLAVYIISVWLASMIMAYHGILQSMLHYRITLFALLCGLLVKGLANVLLIPVFQTMGASIATIAGLSVMLIIIYLLVPNFIRKLIRQNHYLQKLLPGLSIMYSVVWSADFFINFIWQVGQSRTADSIVTFVLVMLGASVFIGYAIRAQLFTKREWVLIPKGKSILRKVNTTFTNEEGR